MAKERLKQKMKEMRGGLKPKKRLMDLTGGGRANLTLKVNGQGLNQWKGK